MKTDCRNYTQIRFLYFLSFFPNRVHGYVAVTRSCNTATSLNNTYFTQPTSTNNALGACTLTVNRINANNVCQIRSVVRFVLLRFLCLLPSSSKMTTGLCMLFVVTKYLKWRNFFQIVSVTEKKDWDSKLWRVCIISITTFMVTARESLHT